MTRLDEARPARPAAGARGGRDVVPRQGPALVRRRRARPGAVAAQRGRLTQIVLLAALLAVAFGVGSGWLSGQVASGAAVSATVVGVVLSGGPLWRLHFGPVLTWALRRTRSALGPAHPARHARAAAAAVLQRGHVHQHRGVAGRVVVARRGAVDHRAAVRRARRALPRRRGCRRRSTACSGRSTTTHDGAALRRAVDGHPGRGGLRTPCSRTSPRSSATALPLRSAGCSGST